MMAPGTLVQEARDLDWQDRALCAETDPEAFFPEEGSLTAAAKRVCQTCEVQPECLAYALRNREQYGIWGGLSIDERRALWTVAA
jgi:WhiB family redox-sensing transcriptional regulator